MVAAKVVDVEGKVICEDVNSMLRSQLKAQSRRCRRKVVALVDTIGCCEGAFSKNTLVLCLYMVTGETMKKKL